MFGGSEVPIKNAYINKDMKPGGKWLSLYTFFCHISMDI